MSDETKINPPSERGESSVFKEPISADLPRRQLDRRILESYDSTQDRIRNISSRVTRIEAIFESLNKDMRRLEEAQKDIAASLEATASSMAAIANRFAIHSEMEEYQWVTVNKAQEVLAKIGTELTEHVKESSGIATRVNWLERMLWALWGVIGAGATALIPLTLQGLRS